MTILEHVYAIQNIMNKGRKSDDGRFSNELIYHFMNVARVILLKREADKMKSFNPGNFQGFCMPLCIGSWAECCGMPEDLNCPVLKSKFKIPRALSGRTNIYIKVAYLSGEEIGRSTHRSVRHRKHTLTQANKPAWFVLNDYLYVTGIPFNRLKAVWVDGLFEDPLKIEEITTCGDGEDPCYDTMNDEYPIDGYLVEPMYRLVLEHLANAMRYPDDNTNNGRSPEIMNDKEE